MKNSRLILDYAEYLNEAQNISDIRKYYIKQTALLKEDVYNRAVTLLCMCINKELFIVLTEDKETSVEDFPNKLKVIYQEILGAYKALNKSVNENIQTVEQDKYETLEYLNNMVKVLLSGVRYIEKKADSPWHQWDEENEWNTRFRREERIRDNMKKLISIDGKYTKFTIKHRIEIPYMYTLAWDLPTLFRIFEEEISLAKNDTSYLGNLRSNTSIALKFISDNMLDILLFGEQVDQEKFEGDNPDAGIKICKSVNYKYLLPTIEICDEVDYSNNLHDRAAWIKARKTHVLPLVKKEVLGQIPLIPMRSEKKNYNPVKSMKMMVDLLKEENMTKDYLESELVYLKDVVVKICKMLLDWIWKPEFSSLRIEKSEVQQYLISIIKAANNVPRKNTEKNREDHIEKIVNVVAKKWDGKLLKDVNVDDNCTDTYIEYAYFSVLKLTRNWNEHNLIKNPSITFAVFLFMVSIRYILEIDKLDVEYHREYLYEESKLFKFFEKGKIDYIKFNLRNVLEEEYLTMYHTVDRQAFNNGKKWEKCRFPENDEIRNPHQVLNVAGFDKSLIRDKMSEYEIYLTFWLSIHYGKDDNIFNNVSGTKDLNLIELLESTFNYQKLSFLLEGNSEV